MQITLHFDDDLYHRAKAKAAKRGQTVSRFVEEALELHLRPSPVKTKPVKLPTFTSELGFTFAPEQLKILGQESGL